FSGNLPATTFEVAEFSGIDRISCPYQFDITLVSQDPDINPDDIIGRPASLFMYRDAKHYPYSGVVTEFQFVDKNVDYSTYYARLVPRMWMTSLNYRTRIFQNVTIPDIIQTVLNDVNVTNFQINTTGSFPTQEYIVQYQETDLNFISRLMESVGIWYYFQEAAITTDQLAPGASEEQLIITDQPQFQDIPSPNQILYRSTNGMNERDLQDSYESIHSVQFTKNVYPSEYVAKNYNYRSPEVDLSARVTAQGFGGTVYEYGGLHKTATEMQNAAQLLLNRSKTQFAKLRGSGSCRALRAGYRFELQEHYRADLCGPFVVTSVTHTGGHNAIGGSNETYLNYFQAIPNDQAQSYAPEKRAFIPKINGVITAQIEANGSEYAALDDKGRYKVRLPFDLSSAKNDCTGSKYVRLAQPYSGAQYGIHFPSHEGTEMVLACVDGDPSKPMGIGTIPNANTISPVVAANKQENVIKTAGNNTLIMDDTDAKQKIKLSTNGAHTLLMDDENKVVCLSSTDRNQLILDDQNKKVVIKGVSHSVTLSYDDNAKNIEILSESGNLIKIDDDNKIITVKTNGGHQIDMDDQGKKIIVKDGQGKNNVTLDGNKGLILNSQGKISITATQDVEISGANIKMKASTGAIEAKATTDLKMEGLNISQKGTVGVKIEGVQFEAKGSASAKIQGTMAEFKGDATATLSGGAMTTVKGAIVMIN
ncbi:MAG: type VI secretion system tip protein VgrG, partial [Fibrobacter sp.]|nr:type VI secretion system tip protein VgrG [Fibrobacter sp.]